jgi:dipeptidyl aminopeptidase/acylaminoacyl peptidase
MLGLKPKFLACVSVMALGAVGAANAADPAPAPTTDSPSLAKLFGQRERAHDIQLSPDGKHAVVVAPGPGIVTYAAVEDVETLETHPAGRGDGKPLSISSCGWSSNTRIVCREYGVSFDTYPAIPFSRTVAIDSDGKNGVYIGNRNGNATTRLSQYDGQIIDWGAGDGTILMTRDHIPTDDLGTAVNKDEDGLGVDRVDTGTGHGSTVEHPNLSVTDYMADGQGNVRIRETSELGGNGTLSGAITYLYRSVGDHQWRMFSRTKPDTNEFTPVAVDGTRNVAYATKSLNGRDAVYSVALDGTFKADLVASNPEVDINDIVTIGRHGRVIGVSYTTDRRQIDYFDPDYKKLAASLGRARPQTPLIYFLGASADEQRLLVFAGSDIDPGHYYTYDRATHHLNEFLEARPQLTNLPMAPMKSVSFKAADGTVIPAYLTLPIGGADKNLPTIVMPHGGPDYRDEWGFDWLVQYFAHRGYAVLQPEYRGSSGYGDAFYKHNGFHSWQTAIGDIADAGRWLIKEGVADPSRLAIVGWSYGGYAALQANVVDPALFKAIVAIAPVTDLGMVKAEASGYTNSSLVAQQIGSGDIVSQGSPARHADRIQAPVLMFHGDHDLNVGVAESRAMDAALHKAGKRSTLVIFPGLDHQLDDSDAREKLLDQSDVFLRSAMNM